MKKNILIILGTILFCVVSCVVVFILGSAYFGGQAVQVLQEIGQELKEEYIKGKPTKIDPVTGEAIATPEGAEFALGDVVKINQKYTVKITLKEERNIDSFVPASSDLEDPFNGTYQIYFVEVENLSEQEIVSPVVSIYNSASGIKDSIGGLLTFLNEYSNSRYDSYVKVEPNRKYSGYFIVRLAGNFENREFNKLEVTDQSLSLFSEKRHSYLVDIN